MKNISQHVQLLWSNIDIVQMCCYYIAQLLNSIGLTQDYAGSQLTGRGNLRGNNCVRLCGWIICHHWCLNWRGRAFNGIITRHQIGLVRVGSARHGSWRCWWPIWQFMMEDVQIIEVRLSFETIMCGNKLALLGWGWWLMELRDGQFAILLDTGLCVGQHRRMRLGGHTTTFYVLDTGQAT